MEMLTPSAEGFLFGEPVQRQAIRPKQVNVRRTAEKAFGLAQ